MTNNAQGHKKALAKKQYNVARSNLLLMIILTAVNILLFALDANVMLLFSATVPYIVSGFAIATEIPSLIAVGIGIAVVILLVYLLCWFFSKKHFGWMVTALILFIIDSIAMVLFYWYIEDFSGVLDILMHIYVLYFLIMGVVNGIKTRNITPEEELAYEAALSGIEDPNNPNSAGSNSNPLYAVDQTVKARVFIEGEFIGHHIAYRRVKHTNQLVIDGYVYDEIEMLIEYSHNLCAVIDGHTIESGLSASLMYIRINGKQVAKKIRWF